MKVYVVYRDESIRGFQDTYQTRYIDSVYSTEQKAIDRVSEIFKIKHLHITGANYQTMELE